MNALFDKLVLCCLCFFSMIFLDDANQFLILFLISISLSGMNFLWNESLSLTVNSLYLVFCTLFPSMMWFYPLILLDIFHSPYTVLRFIAILPILSGFIQLRNIHFLLYLSIISCLSVYIWDKERKLHSAKSSFSHLQDSSAENKLNMQKQQRLLLDKRDSEIKLATLNERNRIAREIHDNVGHMLTRALLQIGALQVINNTKTHETAIPEPELENIKETLGEAMTEIRKSVHNLHDEALDLEMQIKNLITNYHFCPVQLEYDAGYLPGNIKYCFSSIIQEALSNIAKHSNATRAYIVIQEHNSLYQLIIKDNGNLDSKSETPDEKITKGIGISNMKERVDALNGTFHVNIQNNFTLFITIPKKNSERK